MQFLHYISKISHLLIKSRAPIIEIRKLSKGHPMHLARFPRVFLAHLPTPLEKMERLSKELGGPEIWIKRDDCTGLSTGGNKTRKLEFLVGEALAQGCDTLLTAGAAQSNHCRQTAAAAARCGLACHLALGGEAPEDMDGNLLLDRLLGAQIHWCGANRKGEDLPDLADLLRSEGRKPYQVHYLSLIHI